MWILKILKRSSCDYLPKEYTPSSSRMLSILENSFPKVNRNFPPPLSLRCSSSGAFFFFFKWRDQTFRSCWDRPSLSFKCKSHGSSGTELKLCSKQRRWIKPAFHRAKISIQIFVVVYRLSLHAVHPLVKVKLYPQWSHVLDGWPCGGPVAMETSDKPYQ